MLAIKHCVRVPDALVLIYPTLDLYIEHYSPSKLFCLDDYLLCTSFLKACRAAYIQGGDFEDVKTDPFISPICLKEEFLKRLPKIRMVLAG